MNDSNSKDDIIELKVKADAQDSTDDERRASLKKLAGAIAHSLRQSGEVRVRCFGNACIGKAAKAATMARGLVAVHGYDLYMVPYYINADMDGVDKKGIGFICFTNEKSPSDVGEKI